MKDVLEWALTEAKEGDEFLCTRRTFSRIRKRIEQFEDRYKKGIFRNRREDNVVFIWRSR